MDGRRNGSRGCEVKSVWCRVFAAVKRMSFNIWLTKLLTDEIRCRFWECTPNISAASAYREAERIESLMKVDIFEWLRVVSGLVCCLAQCVAFALGRYKGLCDIQVSHCHTDRVFLGLDMCVVGYSSLNIMARVHSARFLMCVVVRVSSRAFKVILVTTQCWSW